ncbi:MAG: hypothetical protein ABIG44_04205, partial [Planctomycetota bacterium]
DGTQIALDIEDLLSSSDIVATHLDDLDALLKANAKPLELVREARSRPEPDGIGRMSGLLTGIFCPSLDNALQIHYRVLAMRRMAATALANRLYELDHGRRPITLEELVPTYLSAVPVDPFAADERVLGYAPHNTLPVLYSVNVDGVDEGGAFAMSKSNTVIWREKDLPFFLDGGRPRRKPRLMGTPHSQPATSRPTSTQAVNDDQDMERGERQ